MNPLFLPRFGTSISVDRRRLIIANKIENSRVEFYPHQIPYDSLIIDGHSGAITFESLFWLARHDISATIIRWNGDVVSSFLTKEPVSGKLRVSQYQKYLDNEERSMIAKTILNQKIANSYRVLVGLSRYYSEIDKAEVQRTFENLRSKYEHSAELLTYEGNVAIFYWRQMRKVFNKLYPNFNFTDRNGSRHSWNMNASDEVNALLNYGYAIAESEVRKDINAIGLDPAVSFLHELANRVSLVYDLQELCRFIVDISVVELLEGKKLKKSDFLVTDAFHLRLKVDTAKALIEKIKVNFNMKVSYKGKNWSYQNILLDNIRGLANYIEGKTSTFTLNIPDLELNRVDDVDLRSRIMSMTIEERKRRGLARNTVWYIQQNLKNGKKIAIYGKVMAKLAKQ
jgi:CRISPR-associated protein Cas1